MNKKTLQRFLSAILNILHIILVILMVAIGLLSLFRPDIIREGIDWM